MTARAAALVGLGLALAHCTAGPGPPDRFYRIVASEPAAPLASPLLPGVLEVERLRSDALTGERLLLASPAGRPSELHRHAYAHWTDPPTTMLRDEIAASLRRAGVAGRVVTPELRVAPDWVLSGRIRRFERVVGDGAPRVRLELELAVTSEPGRALVLLESYREDRPAAGEDVASAVTALSASLDAILGRFLDDLRTARGE